MKYEVEPEPAPEERDALEWALARALSRPADARGPWWREGLRESLGLDERGQSQSS